jgi:hypothetical protein
MSDTNEIRERLARIEEREIARDKKIDSMSDKIDVMFEAFTGAKWVKTVVAAFFLIAGFFIGVYRDALGVFK